MHGRSPATSRLAETDVPYLVDGGLGRLGDRRVPG